MTDIFGGFDLDDIPSNPNFVDKGEYEAIVSKCDIVEGKNRDDEDVTRLRFGYEIDDNSVAQGNMVFESFIIYPHLTSEEIADMPNKAKAIVRKNLSNLKRRLCGTDIERGRIGLGLSEEDAKNLDTDTLLGIRVHLIVVNYGDQNQFTAVRYVNKIKDSDNDIDPWSE